MSPKSLTDDLRRQLLHAIAQNHEHLRSFLLRFIDDPLEVDTTLTEVFARSVGMLDKLEGAEPEDIRERLRDLARSVIRIEWRKDQKEHGKVAEGQLRALVHRKLQADLDWEPDDTEGLVEAVRQSLGGLPGWARQAIDRRYVQGITISELARSTGRSEDSIRMELLRILVLVRDALGSSEAGGGDVSETGAEQ